MFSSSLEALWRAGIVVTPHGDRLSGYEGVFLFKRGQACRISAPPSLVALLRRGLEDTAVVAWRARGTNIASVRIALRLGFEHYGDNLAVRIR